jgi:hypothetical protein
MPVGTGPRFVIEAGFIVAVAVIAAVSKLSTVGIVLTIFAAWALVAAVEWTASRGRPQPAGDGAAEPELLPEPVQPARPRFGSSLTAAVGSVRERRSQLESEPAPPPAPERAVEPAPHVRVLPRQGEAQPAAESLPAVAPPKFEPEPAAARPLAEPVEAERPPPPEPREAPEPVPAAEAVEPTSTPEREPEPVAPPQPPPVLAAAPPPEPEPEPVAPQSAPQPDVVQLTPRGPREWNLWELERLTRERGGLDIVLDEERQYLLMYLREFANSDGILPADFDGLVRDSFGDLVGVH